MSKYFNYYDSPIGKLLITEEDNFLTGISLDKKAISIDYELKETDLIIETKKQLSEYFNGKRSNFDLKIKLNGTLFQIKVWQALANIPFGETRTYKEIADEIGISKGYRAVGNANNKNNLLIVIPCHRVIGSNSSLVGFACGLDVKQYLLDLEK